MAIVELVELKSECKPIDVKEWSDSGRFSSWDGFWVDRNGNVYNVGNYGHYSWATEFTGMTTCELENMGWVHVSYGSAFCFRPYLTRPQKDFLESYSAELGKLLGDIIKNIFEYEGQDERHEKVRKIWAEANQLQPA
jgi:hypothetical protein